METTASQQALPLPPGTPKIEVYTAIMPNWVMPMSYLIMQGQGPAEVINGITVDEHGDLLLYRKLCHDDYMRYPSLIGTDEIWLVLRLPEGN